MAQMKSKILTFLLSVFIAFALWTYVVTNVSVEDTTTIHNVPVVFQNEGALAGRSLMLTEGTGQTVTLTITGTRSEILKLNNNNVSVIVDLSRIYDAGIQSVSYAVNYPADAVTSTFNYVADTPRITLTVEEQISKPVNVIHSYTGRVAEGYMADYESVYIDNRKVTVTGPASVVNQIDHAEFTISLDELTEDLDQDYEYVLCDEEGNPVEVPNVEFVQTDVDKIHVSLSVQRYKEIPLRLDVISGGGATEETTSIVLDTDKIVVSGSDEALEKLEYLVVGEIDLAQIKDTTKLAFPITMPAGVINRTGVETVNVTVSFPALTTKTFTISTIQALNVPEGTEAIVVTKQISVTVRGPRSVVQRMQNSDITVTVDFSDMEVGSTVTKQPAVSISANYPGVGIMENGHVTISLQELPPETIPPEEEPTEDPEAQNNGTEG